MPRIPESGQIGIFSTVILRSEFYDTMEERSKVGQGFQEYGDRHIRPKGTTRTREADSLNE